MQQPNKLPVYARGSVPGALTVFKVAEAVLAGLGIVGVAVSTITALNGGSALTVLPAALFSLFGLGLTIFDGIGAFRYRQGDSEGAAIMHKAWSIRRILLIIAMGLTGIYSIVIMVRSPLTGLIMLAIYEGILAIELIYITGVRDTMECVAIELGTGEPMSHAANHVSGIAVFNAVLTGLAGLLLLFGNLFGYTRIASYYRTIDTQYLGLSALALLLAAARFCLTASCNRAFKRAHSSIASFRSASPAYASPASALGIIGAILLVWMAVYHSYTVCYYIRFAGISSVSTLISVTRIAAYALLTAGLLSKKKDPLFAAGGTILIAGIFLSWINGIPDGLYLFMTVITAIFYALLVAASVMGCAGRIVPRGLRILLIAALICSAAASLLHNFTAFSGTTVSSHVIISCISSILMNIAPFSIGMIAIAAAVGRQPSDSASDGSKSPLAINSPTLSDNERLMDGIAVEFKNDHPIDSTAARLGDHRPDEQ